jgi:hypothetical protein
MIKAHWMKLFSKIDEGMLIDSIIVYTKQPWVQESGRGVVQYHYYLWIDLWIVKLRLDWLGEDHSTPPEGKKGEEG